MSTPTFASTPTVGRIVHFHEEGGPYAAIVNGVNEDQSLELTTFGRSSIYFQHGVKHAETLPYASGTWTWPVQK
jgi:hypothetical protein